MLDSIYHIFTNHLWAPFVSFVKELEAKPAGIYVLIIILIFISVTQSKLILKKRLLQNLPSSTVEASDDKKKSKHIKRQPITSNLRFLIITDRVLTLVCLSLVVLIIGVCYVRFSPAVSDFLKVDTTVETQTDPTTTTTTPSTPTTQPTTTTTTTTYEAPKRLYYYCSCSGCWAEGCPRDGYSYGGYDSYYYYYYHSLCQACKCNSLNAGSFWK